MVSPIQVPGGPELLVIALLVLVPLAVVVGIAFLIVRLSRGGSDAREHTELARRVDDLEQRVTALESERATGETETD